VAKQKSNNPNKAEPAKLSESKASNGAALDRDALSLDLVRLSNSDSTRSVEINLEAYKPYLESTQLSDEEKMELLRTLHSIIASFIDLGFQIGTGNDVCGQLNEEASESPSQTQNSVQFSHRKMIERFVAAAANGPPIARDGG
jgi:hypothetical protein